jgi:hypothetical protein
VKVDINFVKERFPWLTKESHELCIVLIECDNLSLSDYQSTNDDLSLYSSGRVVERYESTWASPFLGFPEHFANLLQSGLYARFIPVSCRVVILRAHEGIG